MIILFASQPLHCKSWLYMSCFWFPQSERNATFYNQNGYSTCYPKKAVYPPEGGELQLEQLRARMPRYCPPPTYYVHKVSFSETGSVCVCVCEELHVVVGDMWGWHGVNYGLSHQHHSAPWEDWPGEHARYIRIYIYTCMYVNHCIYTIVLGHLSKNFNFFIAQTWSKQYHVHIYIIQICHLEITP